MLKLLVALLGAVLGFFLLSLIISFLLPSKQGWMVQLQSSFCYQVGCHQMFYGRFAEAIAAEKIGPFRELVTPTEVSDEDILKFIKKVKSDHGRVRMINYGFDNPDNYERLMPVASIESPDGKWVHNNKKHEYWFRDEHDVPGQFRFKMCGADFDKLCGIQVSTNLLYLIKNRK